MRHFIWAVVVLGVTGSAGGQTTRETQNAATVIVEAGQMASDLAMKDVCCPVASAMEYRPYPPYSAEWMAREKMAYKADEQARRLVHQVRLLNDADWNVVAADEMDSRYLNLCRAVTNELADASLYEHVHGDEATAVESVRDCLHLADLLERGAEKRVLRSLVGTGIRALALHRLSVIVSGAAFSDQSDSGSKIRTDAARELIGCLTRHPDAQSEVEAILRVDKTQAAVTLTNAGRANFILTLKRVDVECDLCAMSLACHIYQFRKGKWPETLEDLRSSLAVIPVDVFGDGKQTLGYALIKHGLPDGGDRPLVWSREWSKGEMFVRTEQPFYCFYGDGDGSGKPYDQRKQGGQFRDVVSWAPAGKWPVAAATQAVVR